MEKIKVYRYEIVLSAPIGDKKGFFTVDIIQDKIEGSLIIMSNKNYFCGTIKSNGSCEISGYIKTLTGIVDYHGSGYLDEENLTLVLNTGNRKLIVSGKALSKGGSRV